MGKRDLLPQIRIAVNARCGRACFYCRPSGEGLPTKSHESLSSEAVVRFAAACNRFGIRSIKLTGGDPSLWPPLVETVKRIKNETAIKEVHVISRHPRIGALAPSLANAGADLINVSLDTLNRELHREITGIDDLAELVDAIHCIKASGLQLKINVVVMKGINDTEVEKIVSFCESAGVDELKLLDVIQDLDEGSESFKLRLKRIQGVELRNLFVPLDGTVDRLRSRAISSNIRTQGDLGHPMLSLQLASGLRITVKDHTAGAWYASICSSCIHYPCHDALMALRLTADSRLQFCLLREDIAIDLKEAFDDCQKDLEEKIADALRVYSDAKFVRADSGDLNRRRRI